MIPTRLRDAWRALRGYAAAQDARASTCARHSDSREPDLSQSIRRRTRATGNYAAYIG